MRRVDREVKDFNEIADILHRCDTIRLGINGTEYPYVVPLSFGFEADADGQTITVFVHGAKEGFKHDLLAKNNRVCVEASILHRFIEVKGQGRNDLAAEYESVIGFGRAEIVCGGEAVQGLNLICEHSGFKNFEFGGEKAANQTRVYKIALDRVTGKRRL